MLLVGFFVPLFLERFLASLFRLTEVHTNFATTENQVRSFLCLACTFALFIANEAQHSIRYDATAPDLAEVREELIKLFFGRSRV